MCVCICARAIWINPWIYHIYSSIHPLVNWRETLLGQHYTRVNMFLGLGKCDKCVVRCCPMDSASSWRKPTYLHSHIWPFKYIYHQGTSSDHGWWQYVYFLFLSLKLITKATARQRAYLAISGQHTHINYLSQRLNWVYTFF